MNISSLGDFLFVPEPSFFAVKIVYSCHYGLLTTVTTQEADLPPQEAVTVA